MQPWPYVSDCLGKSQCNYRLAAAEMRMLVMVMLTVPFMSNKDDKDSNDDAT